MPSSSAIRLQIESALAARIPSALTPVAKVLRPVATTGIEAIDETLHGGLPLGAITELIGPECSGRTSVALSFVAGMTQAGRVCAWIDVSNALDPASAAAAGVDLRYLLWVRCGAAANETRQAETSKPKALHSNLRQEQHFSLPERYLVPPQPMKGLHGGGCGGHPRREVKGMAQAVSGLLHSEASAPKNIAPRCAEPLRRDRSSLGVSALKDRLPGAEAHPHLVDGIGPAKAVPLLQNSLQRTFSASSEAQFQKPTYRHSANARPCDYANAKLRLVRTKPWPRLEQALRAADLLLLAGGFSAIVLDMGGLAPEVASRVPLATWFRYRAAAESTHASILLLAQYGCAKSSAELTLKLEPGSALSESSTVFTGMSHSVEVARRRFTGAQDNVVPLRKPVQRENVANWKSHAAWAGVR